MVSIKIKPVIQLILLLILGHSFCHAQNNLRNYGDLKIHELGQIGFFTNLVNDGMFNKNLGLAGFYGTNTLRISGTFTPVFYDTEISVEKGLSLEIPIHVVNNANFIVGDFLTPRVFESVSVNFDQESFYVGENDTSMVDGYAAVNGQPNFTFPIGDGLQLRPLILNSESENPLARCAYFYENPGSPTSITDSFDPAQRARDLGAVSTTEFWRLQGSVPSTISISWNERSDIASLTDDIATIMVVGWSKAERQWVPIGGTVAVGDLSTGFATSQSFVPDAYEALTFGTMDVPADFLTLENYLVTANGDGINDILMIPELLELSPNNHLKIYNRFGSLVFDQKNYTDQFNGFSNVDNFVIDRQQGLPSDVYFYIVTMEDVGLNFQGFLYLTH